jgi:hypothetical protein
MYRAPKILLRMQWRFFSSLAPNLSHVKPGYLP